MPIITIADVRAEDTFSVIGATTPDSQIATAIQLVEQYIWTVTRMAFQPVFYPVEAPLAVDGSGTPDLLLPIPIITLLQVSEYQQILDLSSLTVYQRVNAFSDDRFNPKISKTALSTLGFGGVGTFYGGSGILRAPEWQPDRLNVQLAGMFGFVEPDQAWLNLGLLSTNVTTVVRAAVAGAIGNMHTVALVGNGATKAVTVTTSPITTGGGLVATGGTAFVFHFQPGVSTVADFEAAVAAQAALGVKVAAASQTALIQATDAVPATYLASSPPPLIKKTALRMVYRFWRKLSDPLEKQDRQTGQLMSESTDGHSYSLGGVIISAGITGDPIIDDVLAMYRRRYGGSTRSLTK